MRSIVALAMTLLASPALAQSLIVPITPQRVLDTTTVYGIAMTIVQPVEADGYLVTEEFLLRDDLRGDQSTNLYYLVSLRPDGAYCSPGWHPQIMSPPILRQRLTVWPIQGIHRLFAETAKGKMAQYPLPFITGRCEAF